MSLEHPFGPKVSKPEPYPNPGTQISGKTSEARKPIASGKNLNETKAHTHTIAKNTPAAPRRENKSVRGHAKASFGKQTTTKTHKNALGLFKIDGRKPQKANHNLVTHAVNQQSPFGKHI